MHTSGLAFVAFAAISTVFTHPTHQVEELRIVGRAQSARIARETTTEAATSVAGLELLSTGNKAFRENIAKSDPALLKTLTDEGQAPPFMFIGCSDSRVSEGTVFNAKPGTLFTQRNIANQFQSSDANAQSVLSYAVAELGVNHIIVMGHYGCGGVAASIASPPVNQIDAANGAIQNWIEPIREIFRTSNRTEIVELRSKNAALSVIEEPDVTEPGFRALVEENVKAGVRRIAADSVISNHFAALTAATATGKVTRAERGALTDVFIHGWVYDIENGEIRDLGISVGPPGKAIPAPPFDAVAKSAVASAAVHEVSTSAATHEIANTTSSAASSMATATTEEMKGSAGAHVVSIKRCEKLCQAKRSLAPMWPNRN
ncbi:carbonic anhydrase [Flammula alnicola]|nr:carbonic anhydrase [Flammula alnicola]